MRRLSGVSRAIMVSGLCVSMNEVSTRLISSPDKLLCVGVCLLGL